MKGVPVNTPQRKLFSSFLLKSLAAFSFPRVSFGDSLISMSAHPVRQELRCMRASKDGGVACQLEADREV